ncbi:hypothetical protein DPSP01_013847 [Paraphaeosphaeria sporulosa]
MICRTPHCGKKLELRVPGLNQATNMTVEWSNMEPGAATAQLSFMQVVLCVASTRSSNSDRTAICVRFVGHGKVSNRDSLLEKQLAKAGFHETRAALGSVHGLGIPGTPKLVTALEPCQFSRGHAAETSILFADRSPPA